MPERCTATFVTPDPLNCIARTASCHLETLRQNGTG